MKLQEALLFFVFVKSNLALLLGPCRLWKKTKSELIIIFFLLLTSLTQAESLLVTSAMSQGRLGQVGMYCPELVVPQLNWTILTGYEIRLTWSPTAVLPPECGFCSHSDQPCSSGALRSHAGMISDFQSVLCHSPLLILTGPCWCHIWMAIFPCYLSPPTCSRYPQSWGSNSLKSSAV